MDEASWEQKVNALTHILINPTTSPSLHSQFFIASQIPCYLHWDYPPLLCRRSPPPFLQWAFLRFLRKLSRRETSWRSKCPYHMPPPLIWANGVEEGQWGDEERRSFARKRFARRSMRIEINPLIPILVPNLLLLSLLWWDPVPIEDNGWTRPE